MPDQTPGDQQQFATGGLIDAPNVMDSVLETRDCGPVIGAAAVKALGANHLREINAAATDPLAQVIAENGPDPQLLAQVIHRDFVVIPRSECGTRYGCRIPPETEVVYSNRDRGEAVDYLGFLRRQGWPDAVLVSRPLLPEIPWEVDPGTAEGVSSGSVDDRGQETASRVVPAYSQSEDGAVALSVDDPGGYLVRGDTTSDEASA